MTGKVQDSSILGTWTSWWPFRLGFHLLRHPKALNKTCDSRGADLQNLGYDEMQFDPATHPLHLDKQTEKSVGWNWKESFYWAESLEICKDSMCLKQKSLYLKYQVQKIPSSAVLSPKYLGSSLKKKQTIHPSEWFSFGYRLWLRQPEANATIGKHVGLLVAPVKSKDRAQAKVMTDYKEDQAAGNWATFEIIFSFQGTITYPLPVCTLESMILRRSPRWDMRSFPGG